MSKDDLSHEAAALSKRGAQKGGLVRAERLGPEDRSEIARQAAQARWGTGTEIAPFVGELRIGDRSLGCAVTETGQRLINQTTMQTAFDKTGGARRGPGA